VTPYHQIIYNLEGEIVINRVKKTMHNAQEYETAIYLLVCIVTVLPNTETGSGRGSSAQSLVFRSDKDGGAWLI